MLLSYSERFLLRKAVLIRRTPEKDAIPLVDLMKFFRCDLTEQRAPTTAETSFDELADAMNPLLAFSECLDDGLLELSPKPASGSTTIVAADAQRFKLRRTREGSLFLENLEPKLKSTLDTIPMSFEGILDFLAMQ